MRIAGFQKSSFVDFPKIISCVVFTPGCNMRCRYCHNKHILDGYAPKIDELEVLTYLNKRKNMLKGVVVSGGEPTLQPDLDVFLSKLKTMGFLVKLDTNGTDPEKLIELCERGLVDYVAMDLKAPIEKYALVCHADIDTQKVKRSVEFLKTSGVAHEFRTTFCPELTEGDILDIWQTMAKGSEYYLQQYREVDGGGIPHPRESVERAAESIRAQGGNVTVRGL